MLADNASIAELHKAQTYYSERSAYSVMELIGQGTFGKVARCIKVPTKETVALKILKNEPGLIHDADVEEAMLKTISILNPDQTNLVKFYERFDYMGQTCLAFEMLDISLFGMIKENYWRPLQIHAIRPIAQQLLVALDALRSLGIMHTDIKSDNVMVVDRNDKNIKVKLIDFGLAMKSKDVRRGQIVQPLGCRAPEVTLGLPYNESIDVWGLGCLLAFLYLADHLFPGSCEYQMMRAIVKMVGQPSDQMLQDGMYTRFYFTEKGTSKGSSWRLLTPQEFKGNIEAEGRKMFLELLNSVDHLVYIFPKKEDAEWQERFTFMNLLKHMLHVNGEERIRPHDALQHSFFHTPSISPYPDGTQQGVIGTSKISEQDSGCHTSPAGSTDEAPFNINKILVSVVDETGKGPHLFNEEQSPLSWPPGTSSGSSDKDFTSLWPRDMVQHRAYLKANLLLTSPDCDAGPPGTSSGSSDKDLTSLWPRDMVQHRAYLRANLLLAPPDCDAGPPGTSSGSSDKDFTSLWPRDMVQHRAYLKANLLLASPDGDASQDDRDVTLSSDSSDEALPPRSADQDVLPDDGPLPQPSEGACISNRALPPSHPDCSGLSYKDVCDSNEVKLAASPPAASAKPGRLQKMLKRLRCFFSRIAAPFCCCLRGEEE